MDRWRSLVGYSPRGRKESDTTERLYFPQSRGGMAATLGNAWLWLIALSIVSVNRTHIVPMSVRAF